jgi:hypothetical protein
MVEWLREKYPNCLPVVRMERISRKTENREKAQGMIVLKLLFLVVCSILGPFAMVG